VKQTPREVKCFAFSYSAQKKHAPGSAAGAPAPLRRVLLGPGRRGDGRELQWRCRWKWRKGQSIIPPLQVVSTPCYSSARPPGRWRLKVNWVPRPAPSWRRWTGPMSVVASAWASGPTRSSFRAGIPSARTASAGGSQSMLVSVEPRSNGVDAAPSAGEPYLHHEIKYRQ